MSFCAHYCLKLVPHYISYSSVPLKAVILSTVVSVAMHLPYFFKWRLEDGRLYRTQFSQSKMDLDYGIVLMVLTKALPIATLCVANVMLIVAVNKSIKRRVLTLNQPRQVKLSGFSYFDELNLEIRGLCCMHWLWLMHYSNPSDQEKWDDLMNDLVRDQCNG